MKEKISKFNEVCPRRLRGLPCEACPAALERINAIKAEGPADKRKLDIETLPGCPWYIASSDYHFCFWAYAQTLYGSPATDKEICDLVLVNAPQLDKITESALATLRLPEHQELLLALMDTVADLCGGVQGIDLTMYLPAEYKTALKEVVEQPPMVTPDEPVIVRRKHPTGLPLHRDGRKVDLYGLYSHKSLVTAREEKKQKDDEKTSNDQKNTEKE